MYVCVCHALNDRDVERAKCEGASRPDDIHKHCGVDVRCGRCLATIKKMLDAQELEPVR